MLATERLLEIEEALGWLPDKTLGLPWEQEFGRRLTLMNADFLVLSADNLRKSA